MKMQFIWETTYVADLQSNWRCQHFRRWYLSCCFFSGASFWFRTYCIDRTCSVSACTTHWSSRHCAAAGWSRVLIWASFNNTCPINGVIRTDRRINTLPLGQPCFSHHLYVTAVTSALDQSATPNASLVPKSPDVIAKVRNWQRLNEKLICRVWSCI